jgi:uncharacterized protein (TIGR00299 family) protein
MSMQGLHLHLELDAGLAGDMMLGALLDAGVPEAVVREALAPLALAMTLEVEKTLRSGLAGTDVKVLVEHHDHDHDHDHGPMGRHEHLHEQQHAHRHYRDILALLERLPAAIRGRAIAMFEPVARAEAKLHGVPLAEVAFHEVGAVDSIVDFVGTAAALAWLAPRAITCSPIALGHGHIQVAHGRLPVPAPATLEILAGSGLGVHDGGLAHELTTPTGAAILVGSAARTAPMPAGRIVAAGYGAGDAELADRPNLARAVLVDPTSDDTRRDAEADEVIELTTNLDDMNPELCEHVAERLFAAGALDVTWTPTIMKRGRPAVILGVLATPPTVDSIAAIIFAETTTLGLRHQRASRLTLRRELVRVDTEYGSVAVKLGWQGALLRNLAPEHADCKALALTAGVPLKAVYAAALAAARRDRQR